MVKGAQSRLQIKLFPFSSAMEILHLFFSFLFVKTQNDFIHQFSSFPIPMQALIILKEKRSIIENRTVVC